MKDFSFITSSHPAYIENLYTDFKKDPSSIDEELRKFFEGYDFATSGSNGATATSDTISVTNLKKEFGVYQLIRAYRKKGHLIAKTNPIRDRKDRRANLSLSFFGLDESDLDTQFEAPQFLGLKTSTLREILAYLQKCYTSSLGIEYSSINDPEKIAWIVNAVEKTMLAPVPLEQRRRILQKLNEGVMFEEFLQTKYVGQKRFSLEGGESTIAALDAIINSAANDGVQEVVIGMAHRGRLNVLANILGKTYEQIFTEFEGTAKVDSTMGSGDVKYHLGFSSEVVTKDGKSINMKLAPNPSHLESVDPVVIGFARSKADVIYNSDYDKILPILIHGDSSLAAQGVIYEVLQMSGLDGYDTGGTLHYVINNQIGFTTDFDDARTSDYCTSAAAAIQAPVFHVNGDDTEVVVKAAQIAMMYRNKFNSDIFIDMVCYRKHGHNEGDDPKYTQPGLYSLIDNHPNPREVYVKYLVEKVEDEGTTELAKEMEDKFWNDLQERLDEIKQNPLPYTYQTPELWWQNLRESSPEDFISSPITAVQEEELIRLFNSITEIPEDFSPLRKFKKILKEKLKLFESEKKFDWATAELLAYASILNEGKDVRMSGQDIRRGTFSHRHAVLRDEKTDETYNRLSNIGPNQGKMRIFNSLLSELAVLGFEYGYAMANPNALVIWEAQFGDFANAAQTVIDEFISSAEQKWRRMNGLILLLPHGYEGQGPDHSSARMERYLQMCAEYNWVITNVTTAANFFHCLRRQLAWPFRKPLINFSPKANLRLHDTYSHIDEFSSGSFKEVIDDSDAQPEEVTKVLLCSGKLYFELEGKKKDDERKDVAVIRMEQIYPLPVTQLDKLYQKYGKAIWYWIQEEPLNMGAAYFLRMNLSSINFAIISRPSSAASSTGFSKVHKEEQQEILDTAFSI